MSILNGISFQGQLPRAHAETSTLADHLNTLRFHISLAEDAGAISSAFASRMRRMADRAERRANIRKAGAR